MILKIQINDSSSKENIDSILEAVKQNILKNSDLNDFRIFDSNNKEIGIFSIEKDDEKYIKECQNQSLRHHFAKISIDYDTLLNRLRDNYYTNLINTDFIVWEQYENCSNAGLADNIEDYTENLLDFLKKV